MRERAMLSPDVKLSPLYIKIVTMIAEGNTNKEIATLVGKSENTVKAYIKDITERLNARNRANIVYESVRVRLIIPD
jgi:DNA-binding NarL/FixJ family response regulator